MSNRLMYFATGDGANLTAEMFAVPVHRFWGATPASATTLDLKFSASEGMRDDADYFDYVRLTIASNTHKVVVSAINDVINDGGKGMILICDKDNSKFINSNITDCTIHYSQSAVA